MRELRQLQQWLQAVIMHPDGVVAGVDDADARRHVDVGPEEAERVVTRSRSLTALERLAIYNNAYHMRLLECLREEFPMLGRALGEEVFDAFAAGYLQKYPSQSYTLIRLGARFPQFLAETAPAAADEVPWPAFLVDLATLEWTISDVFDGPGVEGKPLLDVQRLQSIPPASWPEARLVPADCLRLLALRYPVQRYYAALRDDKDAVPPDAADTYLAVTRRDYVVRHFPLARVEYLLLRALCDGQTVAQACAEAARAAATDLDRFASELQSWFTRWAAEGFFRDATVS